MIGEELPEFLKFLIEIEIGEIENPKIGVLLCGDLFTSLDKRGSSGDVRIVWKEFKNQFDWVIGVAGNHDRFGSEIEEKEFKRTENIYLLHKEIKEIDNLKIGGISGIIGIGDRTNRVDEKNIWII
ncbi:MAG: metallophosphoesterase [Saprospiraceae bacterium]|nr:metallophosphoesterase [Saprospiraceae bacterium]